MIVTTTKTEVINTPIPSKLSTVEAAVIIEGTKKKMEAKAPMKEI